VKPSAVSTALQRWAASPREQRILRAAEAIAGKSPPAWLITGASSFVEGVLSGHPAAEEERPSNKQMVARWERLKAAAQLVYREMNGRPRSRSDAPARLSDPREFTLHDFLLEEGELRLPGLNETSHLLASFDKRCDRNLDALKGKKAKPVAPIVQKHTLEGRTLCAIWVYAQWTAINGDPPGVNNAGASEACAELWAAAGGDDPTAANTGWRTHLESARICFGGGEK
jgi:hypothetical protein